MVEELRIIVKTVTKAKTQDDRVIPMCRPCYAAVATVRKENIQTSFVQFYHVGFRGVADNITHFSLFPIVSYGKHLEKTFFLGTNSNKRNDWCTSTVNKEKFNQV